MNLPKTYRFDFKFSLFGDRQKEVDGMNDHGDISQVRHSEDLVIRLEKEDEYREVENLVRNSFWNVYRPGCLEHYVLDQLRKFFLCKELIPGYLDEVTGEYAPPEGYFVDEKAAEEFDRQFPYKEKKTLPGQIFS